MHNKIFRVRKIIACTLMRETAFGNPSWRRVYFKFLVRDFNNREETEMLYFFFTLN